MGIDYLHNLLTIYNPYDMTTQEKLEWYEKQNQKINNKYLIADAECIKLKSELNDLKVNHECSVASVTELRRQVALLQSQLELFTALKTITP